MADMGFLRGREWTSGKGRYSMKELYHGYFATRIYLPLSGLSRRWREVFRRIRGKSDRFQQKTRLPGVSWRDCTTQRAIRIWEHKKENGNVRISELGILCALAADAEDGTNLFEIGTFDGRTTLNLALNSPAHCAIYTLDLPPDLATRFPLAEGERHMVDKPRPGARYERHRETHPAAVGRIHQLLGDSAAFDFSPYKDSCSLVFVDGSHDYDYLMSDTRAAMEMAKRGGVVVWHDYGVWGDVTRGLDELEGRESYGIRNVSGTSLVFWRKP
ncbi:MAG: class I SAM-dependent methyltransferase [Gammaproteobacteria bacterium]|nr:class I SAM-dependent methyltransferase [Gammaproteobacteria bacterium]